MCKSHLPIYSSIHGGDNNSEIFQQVFIHKQNPKKKSLRFSGLFSSIYFSFSFLSFGSLVLFVIHFHASREKYQSPFFKKLLMEILYIKPRTLPQICLRYKQPMITYNFFSRFLYVFWLYLSSIYTKKMQGADTQKSRCRISIFTTRSLSCIENKLCMTPEANCSSILFSM